MEKLHFYSNVESFFPKGEIEGEGKEDTIFRSESM